jgi:hypothetical protein
MNLKIKFLPYEKYKKDGFESFAKDLEHGTIILIDAKLKPDEEARIITDTMKKVSERFRGIELNSLDFKGENGARVLERIKNGFIELMLGRRRGMTLIGPARIVQKIQKNPEELLLYM